MVATTDSDGSQPKAEHPRVLPFLLAFALVLSCCVYVVNARAAATQYLQELNIQKPFLATFDPVHAPAEAALSERVILVIVDGLGYRNAGRLPYLERLGAAGVFARADAMTPTISRPNYVAIATGVPPRSSGVRTNDYHWPVQLDSVMARVRADNGAAVFASDRSTGFPTMFAEHLSHAMHAPWRGGFDKAMREALRLRSRLVVILPQAVDTAGHLHGAASAEYADAADRVVRQLDNALAQVDLRRETIIITADHGHTDRGGHGGVEDEVVKVPLIMAGAGIRRGSHLLGPKLIDIAPTVAALLGVSSPGHGMGRTLTEGLTLAAAARGRVEAADHLRRKRNLAVVAVNTSEAEAARARRRERRGPIALALLIVGVLAVMGLRGARAIHLDWRVLACALPVFPLTFYGLIYSLGRLSLSSLVEQGFVIHRVIAISVIAIVVHVCATWIALRGRIELPRRLAAANAVTLCGLLVASVPLLVVWALYSASPVLLPHAKMLLLIPVMYGAVVAFAIAAAVVLVLEMVIFLARLSDPRLARTQLSRQPPGAPPYPTNPTPAAPVVAAAPRAKNYHRAA